MGKPLANNKAIARRARLFEEPPFFGAITETKDSLRFKQRTCAIFRNALKDIWDEGSLLDDVDVGQFIAGMDVLLEARLKFYNYAELGVFDNIEKELAAEK